MSGSVTRFNRGTTARTGLKGSSLDPSQKPDACFSFALRCPAKGQIPSRLDCITEISMGSDSIQE